MKILISILLIAIFSLSIYGQASPQIDSLFRNSYSVFELQRLPNGMYRDAILFEGTDYHPISVANTGMGLVALCIADQMKWIDNAPELALETLQTATGHTPGFDPDRTSNGYYRHFINIDNGAQEWDSEYSSIDTDILVSGALFAMNYFQNDSITRYATELWKSIDIEAAIADPTTGQIYLSMNENGSGVSNSTTNPYSEYMIVAWLAKNYSTNPNSIGNTLWDNHYSSTNTLPTLSYEGNSILSDNNTTFLSSFTHQFNYFMCHYFASSNEYMTYFKDAQEGDSAWWATTSSSEFEWGLGAGSANTTAYHADAINNNIDTIVSPHIIAGYLPVNPNSKDNLISLWNSSFATYHLPSVDNSRILWRYSKSDPTWIPNEIIGVDYASMLFGLSTLPEYLGNDFFPEHNNYFPLPTLDSPELSINPNIKIYPNPTSEEVTILLDRAYDNITFIIRDVGGQVVYQESINRIEKITVPMKMQSGIYFLTIIESRGSKTFKVVLQ